MKDSEYSKLWPYILAMAKHESANFTSNVYKANNNPFGMKVSKLHGFNEVEGTKAPDGGFYARYKDLPTAFFDLLEWMRFNRFPTSFNTPDDFVKALKSKGYFTDSINNYLNGVKRWIQKK